MRGGGIALSPSTAKRRYKPALTSLAVLAAIDI